MRVSPGAERRVRRVPARALGPIRGRPKSHPTFTAPGLTYGHNLKLGRLYPPAEVRGGRGDRRARGGVRGRGGRGGLGSAAPSPPAALDSAATPRRALAAEPGGGEGGGGGAKLSALSAQRFVRRTSRRSPGRSRSTTAGTAGAARGAGRERASPICMGPRSRRPGERKKAVSRMTRGRTSRRRPRKNGTRR